MPRPHHYPADPSPAGHMWAAVAPAPGTCVTPVSGTIGLTGLSGRRRRGRVVAQHQRGGAAVVGARRGRLVVRRAEDVGAAAARRLQYPAARSWGQRACREQEIGCTSAWNGPHAGKELTQYSD